MENLDKIETSFYKYLNNELGEEEARQFLEHLQSGADKDVFLQLIENGLEGPLADQLLGKPELFTLLNQSFAKVVHTIDTKPEKSITKLWPGIAAGIAAAVALIILGIYIFNAVPKSEPGSGPEYVNSIKPGKMGATLTLANGKTIGLSGAANGELAKEAGISVTKMANGQLVYEIEEGNGDPSKTNTLTTAKGETYILTLPDKTKVWMNAASSLTYAAGLNQRERKVMLKGEAYFQVAEDKTRPFIVESGGQKIEVLGTWFNVNAYPDEEKVTTTLLKGSVKVSGKPGSKILKPGDQSAVNEKSISITEVDTERAVAWKDNKFLFENDDIRYIMRMIERWYNVEVVYIGEMPTEKFGGGVSRFDNVSQVLKILESTGGAHFKIEGRRILVSK
ncbi:ferric-dicitrate binding protein FerR (iron transport regulator) [Pedobacter sp. AK017]|uniref:FecR family protein n=1 Tax=Pedobacter sp. AK017 TaxID=2723073 RepID=UPI00160A92F2|nr:FecR family protein [Pedobacter sp. AK017]MBB5438743.1 ferric-dicitrate binding protein FerR (iron transport regulator) [Pedobacter sp. AK017]